NRSRTAAAHPLDRVFVWHHQRTEAGGGTGHALGLALVHRTGLRSGDSASLHVLEKPAWTVSGIEVVRGTVRADRAAVCGSGIGRGQASVGGWQFRGGECFEGKPHSAPAVSGSGAGASDPASVSAGTGTAKPGGRTGASAGSGVDHGSRFHLRHQGWNP